MALGGSLPGPPVKPLAFDPTTTVPHEAAAVPQKLNLGARRLLVLAWLGHTSGRACGLN